MQVTCLQCSTTYDDRRCVTICPHGEFLSNEQFARKDRAFSLLQKDLSWIASETAEGSLRIQSIDSEGMVTLRGLRGEVDPMLLVPVVASKTKESQAAENSAARRVLAIADRLARSHPDGDRIYCNGWRHGLELLVSETHREFGLQE